MVALVVVGKLVLWTLWCWLFRQPLCTALLVGVGLTQIGEFSFILVQVARSAGHVGADVYNATLAASLITILINAALVRLVPRWIARLRGDAPGAAPARRGERAATSTSCSAASAAWAARSARRSRLSASASWSIERDPDIVRGLRSRGVPCLFGDAAPAAAPRGGGCAPRRAGDGRAARDRPGAPGRRASRAR